MSHEYDATDFGWVPDWDGDPARPFRDNAPAIMSALDFIRIDRGGRGGGTLWIDGWGSIAQPIVTRHQGVSIRGTGASNPGGPGKKWFPGTQIVAAPGITAFRVHGMTDLDAPENPAFLTSYGMRFLDMTIVCPEMGATGHGMHISAPASVERCVVEGFGGDGIAILADRTNGGTAAQWYIERTTIGACGGVGLNVEGGDADVGHAMLVNCSGNRGGGFRDFSLGNLYSICHAAGNGPDPNDSSTFRDYVTTGAAGESQSDASVFVGCYTESGDSFVHSPCLIVGGQLANRNKGTARAMNGAVELGRAISHLSVSGVLTTIGDGISIGIPSDPSVDHTEIRYSDDRKWLEIINSGSTSRRVRIPTTKNTAPFNGWEP